MAHTRKDTLTKPVEWWKHLRPFNKRRVAKRERKASELTGTTWYRIRIEPEPYWGWITDKMIEMIHMRVLNHIKYTVETL